MKLLILTTQTTHHAKFVQEIAALWPETKTILETTSLSANFDTAHPYLEEQERYERDTWFEGQDPLIADMVETVSVRNINDAASVALIKEHAPDLVIVFGTGKIDPALINLVPGRMVNLHGGDPEHYRGLDTHLWAIYHGEFEQLVTCLHEVAPALDTGDIIGLKTIEIAQGMALHQLRAQNTQCCIDLTKEAIENLEAKGRIDARAQTKVGRYYSFMPAVLKDLCVRKFQKHTETL